MFLCTVQPIEVYNIIERKGVFHATDNLIHNPEYKRAYEFMNQQLDKKSPKPIEADFPVWAWAKLNGGTEFSSLMNDSYGPAGQDYVLMYLSIPDERILCSDLGLWHFVLNNSWIDDSKNSEEYEQMIEAFDRLPASIREEKKRESWNKIFNLDIVDTPWVKTGFDIQAVFWELKKEDIVNVIHFKTKKEDA